MKANITDIEAYTKERDAVLRTLNREAITAFYAAHGLHCPRDAYVFWCGVHKAASAMAGINIGEWLLYAQWLEQQGSDPPCDRWAEAERYLAAGGKPWPAPAGCNRPGLCVINKGEEEAKHGDG